MGSAACHIVESPPVMTLETQWDLIQVFFLFPFCLAIDALLCWIRPLVSFLLVYLPPSWQEIKCRAPQVPNKAQTRTRQDKIMLSYRHTPPCSCTKNQKKPPKTTEWSERKEIFLHPSKNGAPGVCTDIRIVFGEPSWTFFFFALVFKEMGVYLKRESVYLMYHTPPKSLLTAV